jgi:thiamine-phosphate pyrophosphorylase
MTTLFDFNIRQALDAIVDLGRYSRWTLGDLHLAEEFDQLRRELADVLAHLPGASRSSAATPPPEPRPHDEDERRQRPIDHEPPNVLQQLLDQSLSELQESVTSLYAQPAAKLGHLRQRAGLLARAVQISLASRARFSGVGLYVLVDGGSSLDAFASLVRGLLDAGVRAFQLRDKSLGDRQLFERARALRRLTASTRALAVVNDRPDLAVLADADGVHVGQEDLAVREARAMVGNERLVGVSTHTLPQARQAVLDGADYIGCGPTFPSTTKTFDSFAGADFLKQVARQITLPAFAIGGVGPENLAQVIDAGFLRVAVSSAVTQSEDPAASAKRLLVLLDLAAQKQESKT